MFLTDDQILQRVSDALLLASASPLPPPWASTIVPDAHARAYGDLVTILTSRGYLPARIAAWDRGAEVEGDLAVFYALSKGAGLLGLDDKFLKTFDRRADLRGTKENDYRDALMLTAGGAAVDPGGTAGLIGTGRERGHDLPPGEPLLRRELCGWPGQEW